MKNTTSTLLAATLISLLAVSQSAVAGDAPRDEYSIASLVASDTDTRVNYSLQDYNEEGSTNQEELFPEYEH